MAPRISLALAIHNHQPVGNFGWVFAEVYEQAYEPMVAALERHPASASRSTTRDRCSTGCVPSGRRSSTGVVALVERDQVEIMGGGYYEPVLASLPERDRIGQALRMGDELETLFGRRPAGAWLAERVWEPDLPTSLVAAGYDWTILDDAHFRAAAIREDDLWGPYTTDDQGQRLRVFGDRAGAALPDPVPRGRRGHRLPARARQRGRRTGRDDGRRRREVRGVADDLGALLGRGPLGRPVLRGARGQRRLADDDHADRVARRAPADRSRLRPDRVVRRDGRMGAAAGREPGLRRRPPRRRGRTTGPRRAGCAAPRGATSRSATARSTTSTSRCCGPRTRWPRCPTARTGRSPRTTSTMGQSNDCYWHGLFGGIYIGHMRLATCEHLIAAEDLADTAAGTLHAVERLRPRSGRARRRPAGGRRAGRLGRPDGGRRDRRLGHPARPARPVRGPPPPAGGVSRDAARAGRRDGRVGDRRPPAGRPRSTSAWR